MLIFPYIALAMFGSAAAVVRELSFTKLAEFQSSTVVCQASPQSKSPSTLFLLFLAL
jgi:hypothetical protein